MGNNRFVSAVSILGPPSIVAAGAGLTLLLPAYLLAILGAWTALSVPIGMLVGRCIHGEE